MAAIAKPISDLLRKDKPFKWERTQQDALNHLVDAVTTAPILAHFDPTKTTHLYTDASKYAIGGWLGQKDAQDQLRPIVFYSRKMTREELGYPVQEQELLALIAMVETHPYYIGGAEVIAHVDHKPLEHLQTQPILSNRQVRWVTKLQSYNIKIEHIKGSLNTVADFLSRQPYVSPKCSICQAVIKDYQPDNTEAPSPDTAIVTAIEESHVEFLNVDLIDLTGQDELQQEACAAYHDTPLGGHQGIKRTMEKIRRKYIWQNMKETVTSYINTCDQCERHKSLTHKPDGLLHNLSPPNRRLDVIGMDWFHMPHPNH
jgi:hypothetical protein